MSTILLVFAGQQLLNLATQQRISAFHSVTPPQQLVLQFFPCCYHEHQPQFSDFKNHWNLSSHVAQCNTSSATCLANFFPYHDHEHPSRFSVLRTCLVVAQHNTPILTTAMLHHFAPSVERQVDRNIASGTYLLANQSARNIGLIL